MKNLFLLVFLFCLPFSALQAQDDDSLLSILGEEETTDYVIAAFKTNRVMNGHSIESTAKGVLDFKISHRFGMINTGFTELYGLDNAMIRIGFDYGITDQLTIGLGRSNFQKIYDGFLKYKFLRQKTGKKNMPISAAFLTNVDLTATKVNPDPRGQKSSRYSFTQQLLIGRKFTEGFSLQIMPTFVHRNLVAHNEKNDVIAIGIAARQKIAKRIAITVEYYNVPGDQLPSDNFNDFHHSLAIGFDLETGGHVFQLHFTNSTSIAHKGFITETVGDWTDGGIHFGFNVSRVFTIKK